MAIVLRARGLRGELVARLFNPASELWRSGERFWVDAKQGPGRWLELEQVRRHGGEAFLAMAGIRTREQAEDLVGAELGVDRARLPAAPAGEVYLADLVGWTVQDRSGRSLGRVIELVEAGKTDFLVVEEGAERNLLPVQAGLLRSADAGARLVTLSVEVETGSENSID